MNRRELRSALDVATGVVKAHDTRRRELRQLQQRLHSTSGELRSWSRQANVQGFGVALRTKGNVRTRELVLKVYVTKKRPLEDVEHPIPRTIRIPGVRGRVPIDVEEIGEVRLHAPQLGWQRPASPGYSVGPAGTGAGTFGCLVRRYSEPESLFMLSSCHVLTGDGALDVGAPIAQPAPMDGSGARNPIATLDSYVPIAYQADGYPNRVDAAIARITDASAVVPALAGLDAPRGVNTAVRAGMRVRLSGRSSGVTTGVVRDADFRIVVDYPLPGGGTTPVGFSDQVLCDQFAREGDSGAAVIDADGNIVGLHCLGSRTVSVFNKIENVLSELNCWVVNVR